MAFDVSWTAVVVPVRMDWWGDGLRVVGGDGKSAGEEWEDGTRESEGWKGEEWRDGMEEGEMWEDEKEKKLLSDHYLNSL